jgi:exonuclease VII small subunit
MPPPDTETAMVQDHERKIIRLEAKVEMLEQKTERLEDELKVYQAAAISADKKMTQVLAALVGDADMQVKGLMQRIEGIEKVTDMVKELRWKFAGGLVVVGWAMAFGYWVLQHIFK